jgi:hypothetical protein
MESKLHIHIVPAHREDDTPMKIVLINIKEPDGSIFMYSDIFYMLYPLQEGNIVRSEDRCKKLLLSCNRKNPLRRPQFKYSYNKKEINLCVKGDNTKIRLTLPYRA